MATVTWLPGLNLTLSEAWVVAICIESMVVILAERERLEAQRLLDEATKNGYVTSQSIVIILVGIAGSGKSSFKRLILDLPPEEERISTSLAEAAIRNISISRAIVGGSEAVKWEVVSSEELLKMVADAVKEVGSSQATLSKGEVTNSSTSGDSISNSELLKSLVSLVAKDKPRDQDNSSTSEDAATKQQSDTEFNFEDDPLLPLITKSKGSEQLFNVHWVYIIDTGGQPQFLQLLPAFIKGISSCVCFVRLDQGLDEKPLVKYFDKSGKQSGESYPSEHTNLQLVESCVRTIYSKCCLYSEAPPNCFVVGTHLDEYEKSPHPETIEMKNKRLAEQLLDSLIEKSLIFYEAGDNGKLIFPLNCKNPEDRDQAVTAEFRKFVMNHCKEPTDKIPLAWFILEERIRQYATKKKVAYVTRDTCLKIASTLHMTEETFQAALNHLLKLNIFRSYSSLPDLIFCDTQVVLFKLTELVQYSFQLQRSTIRFISGEDLIFKNQGVISRNFLSRFPQFFSESFTPGCFLKILRELLAVADLENKEYFMPCLLKELSPQDFNKHRCSSESLSTLLLCLDGKCLPNGLFTSLIASLKNSHQWVLSQKNRRPACLYQNCVRFRIPGGLPGVVTLIASFSFIEVHLNCPIETEVDKSCSRVYNDIRSGLQASWNTLYPDTSVNFNVAFFCTSCAIAQSNAPGSSSEECPVVVQSHHATVNAGGLFETCSRDDGRVTQLSEAKIRWLKNTGE